MKTKSKVIILVAITIPVIVIISGFIAPIAWLIHPCQLGFEAPHADAIIISMSIDEIYSAADVIVTGTIVDSYPWCFGHNIVTFMTLDVSEYIKNPLPTDKISLKSLGGNIGSFGRWVEDEQIYNREDKVLLFLNGPNSDNTFDIMPYSILISNEKISATDLLKGIELRTDNQFLEVRKGDSGKFTFNLDSFFGYEGKVSIGPSSFIYYNSTEVDTSYEDPLELKRFGIMIEPITIDVIANTTNEFEVPVSVKSDAMEGRYFINMRPDGVGLEGPHWQYPYEQIQVFVTK